MTADAERPICGRLATVTGQADRPAKPSWERLAAAQSGVLARRQLLTLGLSDEAVEARLRRGQWVRLHPGIYLTFTGPVPALAQAWGAVLAAGDRAVLGGRTALWLWGVLNVPETVVTVCVPGDRRVVAPAGVQVRRRRRLDDLAHPAVRPPRLRVEEAVLDVTAEGTEGEVVDLVLRATSGRRTTPDRIAAALRRRHRHPHRALLQDLLDESAEGVQSPLELRYRRGVERAHGLPRGERNVPERVVGRTGASRTRYRDIRYRRWRVVVELDGREAHPAWRQRHDRARDNSATVDGDRVLVYGWYETVVEPCEVAVEVIRLLRAQGWRGTPHPCGDGCPVADLARLT